MSDSVAHEPLRTPSEPPGPAVSPLPPDKPLQLAVAVQSVLSQLSGLLEAYRKKTEETPPPKKREPKDFWDILQIVFAVASGVTIFVYGTLINGKVDGVLKERQLHSENVRQMQPLVADLVGSNTQRESAQASAITLAAYGKDAVPILLYVLRLDSGFGPDAAHAGLRAIESSEKGTICSGLNDTLTNRTRLYSFAAHRRTLELMGELDCREHLSALREYKNRWPASTDSADDNAYPFRGIGEKSMEKTDLASVQEKLDAAIKTMEKKQDASAAP